MNIFLRTNFNKKIGLGHLLRMLRIYSFLKEKRNYNCQIFVDRYSKKISRFIHKSKLIELYQKGKFKDQIQDAKKFYKSIKYFKSGYVFVDDYRLDEKWEKYISNKNFSIVSFDDTNLSNHYSDYLINYDPQYIDKSKFDFKKNKKKKSTFLLGPQYSILPNNINHTKIKKNRIFKIIINFGGSGNLNLSKNIILQFIRKKYYKDIEISVVIGPLAKNRKDIFNLSKKFNFIKLVENRTDLINIYQNHHLYIGAAGTSVFETAISKIQTILIKITENQSTNIFSLEKLGHFIFLDRRSLSKVDKLVELIISFKKNYSRLRKTFRPDIKIDTNGLKKIINVTLKKKKQKSLKKVIKNKKKKDYKIVKVNDKYINNYFYARNLEINTRNSTNSNKINILDHYNWWMNTKRKSFLLQKNNKNILYFYEEKIFSKDNKIFYLSGWFACSKNCMIKDILYALNWQRRYKRKKVRWLSYIKKNNKLSISLSKYLGWKQIDYKAIKKNNINYFKKINYNKFIFYER